ncbi:MAG TPA: dihydroorotate dehydrogenase-like protein [Tepidisphaeraceae bacterium]|nr:dihydroorotate dehydrogenase-like protein [Tepidisphaeraceae bacterium]
MDLSTSYLGLKLRSPLMSGASPLADDMDMVRRLEDSGAGAIVMHSLFEEQITGEKLATIYHMELYSDSYSEALNYFPRSEEFAMGPDQYLEHLRKVKQAVAIPVIASLNGSTPGGWTDYAKQMEQAGADALELNTYTVATDAQESGNAVENRTLEVIRAVIDAVSIPVAVKISPFYSSLANFVYQLEDKGIDGLVLFNRFYQPDIDIELLEVKPTLKLSDSSELLLRLRWLAILSRQISPSLACSGGVHTGRDAIKAIMTGADGVQVVSALLRHGPEYLLKLREEMVSWMEENCYSNLREMRGSMGLARCPDPQAFERANYMRTLHSWGAT